MGREEEREAKLVWEFCFIFGGAVSDSIGSLGDQAANGNVKRQAQEPWGVDRGVTHSLVTFRREGGAPPSRIVELRTTRHHDWRTPTWRIHRLVQGLFGLVRLVPENGGGMALRLALTMVK